MTGSHSLLGISDRESRTTGVIRAYDNGIPPELCSLQYAKVDYAVDIIRKLGRGTQLVKLDIKDAYRIVPVHPADYHFLGIEWRGFTYIDRALPFELHSAPKIFNAVPDFIAWVLACKGVNCQLHYLDNFLLIVAPYSQQGHKFLAIESINNTRTLKKRCALVSRTEVQQTQEL